MWDKPTVHALPTVFSVDPSIDFFEEKSTKRDKYLYSK